jgi:hypothetical protein
LAGKKICWKKKGMVLEEKKAERRREAYVVVLYILQIYSIKEKSGRESLGELRRRFVLLLLSF